MIVLVSSFRFIWIPLLWIYGHNKYLLFAGIDFTRQIMSFKVGPRSERVKSSSANGTRSIYTGKF